VELVESRFLHGAFLSRKEAQNYHNFEVRSSGDGAGRRDQ
jgi:hypothetical protein